MCSLPPLVETDAKVFERGVIQIETLTRGSKYPDELRAEVQDLPELCFLFPALFLGAPMFAQVEDEHGALARTLQPRA